MTPPAQPPLNPDDTADRSGTSAAEPLAAQAMPVTPEAAATAAPDASPGAAQATDGTIFPAQAVARTAGPITGAGPVTEAGPVSGEGQVTGEGHVTGEGPRPSDGTTGGMARAPLSPSAADNGFFAPHMLRGRALTLGAAICGAVLFISLGLPLPLLLGPMLGCLAFALAGAPLRGMGIFGIFMRTFLGVAIGATVTPELIRALPSHIATLALVPLFILVIGGIGYPFFRKVMGFDHATAFYSAMPGGLQDMLIFGEEAGGDVRAMSLAHATRVLVIVTAAPVLLQVFYGADLTRPPGVHIGDVPLHELALMVLAGLGGWQLAERVHLFGASILGPLIATACLSLAGLIHQRPPAEVIWAAQFFIGIAVGAKYAGITRRELRVFVGAGVAFSLLLAVISVGFIEAAIHLSSAPPLDLMLSFLPGGQGEMAVIAIVTGADVAFVVTHHLTRIFLVIIIAPVIGRWAQQRANRRAGQASSPPR